jgi:LuxR family transcriptional regulator, maltose regulon positive regulatory protein
MKRSNKPGYQSFQRASDFFQGLQRLNIEKDHWRLCLLVAPTRSGKTKALRSWVNSIEEPEGLRAAWLGLQPNHNQPERFRSDLTTCLRVLDAAYKDPPNHNETSEIWIEKIAKLIDNLVDHPSPFILILDNYEVIEAAPIHQAVILLLDYLPPQAKVVIASQSEPPLQLPKLRVRRQLVEMGPLVLPGADQLT